MEWKHSGDMLKHLEKQREILMQAYRSLSHDLHTLQVEEEMLMRKLHELVPAEHSSEKSNIAQSTADNREGVPPDASASETHNGI
ncbi:uncharacterized protein LOC116252242 [Nymphaea colorata]|nr:uncharacterized protein LOC116252242 [Nymphaea colorata]XP_031482236.1 uncharacterized protein LOC116252242 [Nymphaea colorata]XP_031482237.1 uncharacterized protein LOC116252242 [Nymphaea colorata]